MTRVVNKSARVAVGRARGAKAGKALQKNVLLGYMIFQQLFNVGAERLASFSSLGRSAEYANAHRA
jgi:hypothetical protein